MNRLIRPMILMVVVILGVVLGARFLLNDAVFYESETEITDQEAFEAFELLNQTLNQSRYTYFDYLKEYEVVEGDFQGIAQPTATQWLGYEEAMTYEVTVPESGMYRLYLAYDMSDDVLNNATIEVEINGERPFYEAATIDLPILWHDVTKDFERDSYNDEALPLQVTQEGFMSTGLFNNTYYTAEPLLFYLEEGSSTIRIINQSSSDFLLGELTIEQPKEMLSYEAYINGHQQNMGSGSITTNGIFYTEKNSSYVRMESYQSPTVSPFDPVDKKMNVIAGESWYNPGKSVSYDIEVEKEGFYQLALHGMITKDDYNVFRSVAIDGEIPYKEVKAYPLKDTSGSRFLYEPLEDEEGEPYLFYLTEGSHKITFKAELEPIAEDLRTLRLVIDHINQFALDIRKVTGKEVDKNRTWRITEYMPMTEDYLKAYDTLIKSVIDHTKVYAPDGASSATLSYLQKALTKLDRMMQDPDELPLYFEQLYSGTGSVNQMLGDSMDMMTRQPYTLNEFTFYGESLDKKDNASFFSQQAASLKTFISSFTSKKYVVKNDPEVLNVWVNRPITHVDTLQKMVDSQFTPETGIKVKISVMPDANKLVLASAAGEAPDVAMGLLSYMPFDLAIRGAAYDLTSFDDFWEVSNRFTAGAFVPYLLEDRAYALPETLEFFTLVYRKDIFDSLGLEPPDTWQDVTEMLPELQRYGMNFFHPISGIVSLKWFFQTSPFIYQAGGTIYSEDGLEATIDDPSSVEGLTYLSKLFTMYSLPPQEPLFYNAFRYGSMPVGIADFTTYMQIKNAAPELVGQWALAPYPGMVDKDGNFNRWYIANGRGTVIMENTSKADEAWTFLKWWTSEEVQTAYSYTMQSIYGPEYLWLSSNLEAVKNSPIDIQDKMVILEQIKWLRDVPRTPGQYMLERGLSDIWNKSVFDNVPTRIAIDQQVITINREIKRKMIEFGYLDENGEILKPYTVRDVDWIEEQMKKGREE